MAVKPDIEGAKKAISAQLLSNDFAAVLLAIYEEKDEEAPVEIFAEGYTTLRWAPQNFPNFQMGPARGVNQNSESVGYLDIQYEFPLFVEVTNTDEQKLDDALSRMVRALQDFYAPRPNLLVEGKNISIWTGDEDYSPLINQGDGRPFIQAAAVTIFLRMQR